MPGSDDAAPLREATAVLESSALDLTRRDGESSDADPASPPMIGRYRVDDVLGSGGMGTAYRGWDPRLRRPVAVKVIRASRSPRSSDRRRLFREAQALAAFAHPNVVAVYEVGTHEGAVFIAMELVLGQTLRSWAKDPDRTWQDIVLMYVAAGRGLVEAHRKGIIHRDFKPANVLVGDDGRARVLDFGLATAVGHAAPATATRDDELALGPDAERLTLDGAVMGTPAYMAPEQARGEPVTPASDQFSFCVSLWEGLTMRRPYRGDTLQEVQRRIKKGLRTPPPEPVTVPAHVLALLDRGLEHDVDRRWPTLPSLLDALEAACESPRRAGWAWGLVGVGALAGIAAWSITRADATRCEGAKEWAEAWPSTRRDALADQAPALADVANAALDSYAERWVAAHDEACEAGAEAPALLDVRMQCLRSTKTAAVGAASVLTASPALTVEDARSVLAGLPPPAACLEPSAATPANALPRDPRAANAVVLLRARLSAARAQATTGKTDAAYREAVAVHQEAQSLRFVPLTVQAQTLRGLLASRNGDLDDAQEQLTQAFWGATDVGDEEAATEASIEMAWLTGYLQGRHAEGVEWVRHFEAAMRRRGRDPSGKASQVLGPIYFDWDRLEEARPHLEASLQEALRDADDDLGVGIAQMNLGNLYYELAQPRLAQRAFDAARARLTTALPDGGPDLLLLDINQGAMLLDLHRDAASARPMLARGLAKAERVLGAEHPTTALALTKVAQLRDLDGDLASAEGMYERALEIYRDHGSELDVLTAESGLALAYHRAGNVAASERLWQKVATEAAAKLGPTHVLACSAQYGLGRLAEGRHDLGAATALFESALSNTGEHTRADALNVRRALVRTLLRDGRLERAEALAVSTVRWATNAYGPDSAHAFSAEVSAALVLAKTEPAAGRIALRRLVLPPAIEPGRIEPRAEGLLALAVLIRDEDRVGALALAEEAKRDLGPHALPFERRTIERLLESLR
ncbi:MAG: serine/threonine-protein kinase [Myxococcota bacterium]